MSAFIEWCEQEQCLQNIPNEIWQQLVCVQVTLTDGDQNNSLTAVKELSVLLLKYVVPLLIKFKEFGRVHSPTFKYLDMFLDAEHIMLLNIRAEREGNWALHLHTVAAMLPYFFSTNRTNYARWVPVYILEMLDIPENVRSALEDGQFSVREIPGRFNGIWSDNRIKQS